MAFRHGKNAQVTVNAVDLTAFCDTAELSTEVDTADVSTFGNTYKASLAGQAGGSFSISGSYDPVAATGPAAVLSGIIGTDAVAISHKPGGTLTGQRTNTFNAILTSYNETSEVGDKIAFSAEFMVTGTITRVTQ